MATMGVAPSSATARRAPQALLFAVEPDELHRVVQRCVPQGERQRVQLRDADAVVDRALPKVPAVEMSSHDEPAFGAAGEPHHEVGGVDRPVAGVCHNPDAYVGVASEQSSKPEAFLLGNGVHRDRQRLAEHAARAGEQLTPAFAVDEEYGGELPGRCGRHDFARLQRCSGANQPDRAGDIARGIILRPALPDVYHRRLERRMRLRVAQRCDAQRAGEWRDHVHAILGALPAGHGEAGELRSEAERAQLSRQPLQGGGVRSAARHPAAVVVTQLLQQRVGRERFGRGRDWCQSGSAEPDQGPQQETQRVHASPGRLTRSPSR
jgi:hypothetical protein